MTYLARLVLLALVAGTLAASSAASPGGGLRDVAFLSIRGHGTVTSTPAGIHCPAKCRAIFPRGTHVRLHAAPAAGWGFDHFEGKCATRRTACGFDLVSPHDCIGGACPIGAFGVRVVFVRLSGTM